MKVRTIAYWTTTGLLAFMMLSGALGELTQSWGTPETVTILRYPPYFLNIIGLWKIAGSLAVLIPGFARLKEWAYAGMFFNMTGAFVSHAAVADYGPNAFHLIATGATVVLVLASWALRPQTRTVGTLFFAPRARRSAASPASSIAASPAS